MPSRPIVTAAPLEPPVVTDVTDVTVAPLEPPIARLMTPNGLDPIRPPPHVVDAPPRTGGALGDPCFDVVKSLAVRITCPPSPPPPPAPPPPPPRSFVADFGRELQGGLRLEVTNGTAGETVHIACGESFVDGVVGTTCAAACNGRVERPYATA